MSSSCSHVGATAAAPQWPSQLSTGTSISSETYRGLVYFWKTQPYLAVPTPSRKYKKSTEDAVIAETLNTQDTIKASLTMHKKPAPGDGLITETRTLLSLGHGVNGYPGLVHRGIVGLFIDEAMGIMLQLNANAGDADIMGFIVTAYLKTKFLRPVRTPSIVLLTAELKEREGRKIYISATVENEAGDVLAAGEAFWILGKESQAKL